MTPKLPVLSLCFEWLVPGLCLLTFFPSSVVPCVSWNLWLPAAPEGDGLWGKVRERGAKEQHLPWEGLVGQAGTQSEYLDVRPWSPLVTGARRRSHLPL